MPSQKTHNWRRYFPTLEQPHTAPSDGITNDPTWRKGGFEVISSDGVRFRIDPGYLACR
jgi:hypothetical protein